MPCSTAKIKRKNVQFNGIQYIHSVVAAVTTILFRIIFIIPEGNPIPAKQSLSFCLSPKSLATTHGFSDFYVYPVLDISHNGIIQYMASCVWLLSLNEVSRLIRMLACTSTYFLFHCLGGDNGRTIKSSLIIFIIFPSRLIVAAGLEMCLTYFFFNRKCDVCYKMLTLIVIYCL